MNMSKSPRLGIVGGGRAAWAFGSAWLAARWPIAGISLRDGSSSPVPHLLGAENLPAGKLAGQCDVILLAVPDTAIAPLAETFPAGPVVFHASGALGSDVLSGHERRFSLHPLRALPVAGTPAPLRGALLVWEGTGDVRWIAERLAEASGCRLTDIDPEAKLLYHAAAVFSSNYVATLLDLSRALMSKTGMTADLEEALAALAHSAVTNWEERKGRERFTGPVARGDLDTVRRHIDALAAEDQEIASLYAALARHTALRIADEDV